MVEDFVLDLGTSRTWDAKFYRTLELYWHTQTFVARAFLSHEMRLQLKQCLKNWGSLLVTLGTQLAKWHGGIPPSESAGYSKDNPINVSAAPSAQGPHLYYLLQVKGFLCLLCNMNSPAVTLPLVFSVQKLNSGPVWFPVWQTGPEISLNDISKYCSSVSAWFPLEQASMVFYFFISLAHHSDWKVYGISFTAALVSLRPPEPKVYLLLCNYVCL